MGLCNVASAAVCQFNSSPSHQQWQKILLDYVQYEVFGGYINIQQAAKYSISLFPERFRLDISWGEWCPIISNLNFYQPDKAQQMLWVLSAFKNIIFLFLLVSKTHEPGTFNKNSIWNKTVWIDLHRECLEKKKSIWITVSQSRDLVTYNSIQYNTHV